ncbi:MAG: type II secretion system F family protein [Candidatus Sumerlaeaceae bacterium]|jgi:type IV pilus assembly protein PilC
MAAYCRQLATLVDVGVPLVKSLQILAERSAHKKLRAISADLARRLEEGQSLSLAMAQHPRVFSPLFVSVVRTGEAGGILDISLRHLADLLERNAEIRRRVVGAMIYPLIALMLEIVIIALIMIYALPKLVAAYPKPEDLPAITRALMGFASWFAANWLLVLLIVVGIIILCWLVRRSPAGRAFTQSIALRLPLVGPLIRKINVERFARTLGNLTAAGIPLIDALAITADTADNEVVRRTLLKVRDTVEKGGKMDEPMRSTPIFDALVIDMVMVGDEAGALDTMLLKIADTYDSEVDVALKGLSSILEPLLIIFLGLAVGFLAVAVFLPYVSLVRNPALMPE